MMRERHRAYTVMLFLLIVVLPTQVAAQLQGTVVDQAGAPLEGVAVEAWSGERRLGARLTDESGLFVFPAHIAAQTTSVSAGRLGFGETRVSVSAGMNDLVIELEAQPIILQPLIVQAERNICADREDRRARLLWESVRAHYSGPLDTVGVATYLAEAVGVVEADRVGTLELPDFAASQRSSSSLLRFSWRRRIERQGYAFSVRRNDTDRSYDSWAYPPLEADFATHFVDEVFGKRHEFHVDQESSEGTTLAFCTKDEGKPSIKGTLFITSDSLLSSAEWSFQTPEPFEAAGGKAIFSTRISLPKESHLLPKEGLFWRQVPGGGFLQIYQQYEDWILAPGDSVPRLPAR